jgi:hypothetical protein
VIRLLDEGDSLLGQRTDVQNANDRYANPETNFLLQRFESYEGILLVTTNARAGRKVGAKLDWKYTAFYYPWSWSSIR